jgi:hypothetical protein
MIEIRAAGDRLRLRRDSQSTRLREALAGGDEGDEQ